jgi:UDP-N-acetylmuramoyl-L-alanyl-D-glutamate--2,6-diaminopimelate ligase
LHLTDVIGEDVKGAGDIEITGLTADSRAVRPGYLFAALRGSAFDGTAFIGDAVARGAAAVLMAPNPELADPGVPVILDPRPRHALSLCAARFYGEQPETIAAVTGTSGKTSVAEFTRQIWAAMRLPAASLGTLGVIAPDSYVKLAHTSPDPVRLHAELRRIAREGVGYLALEASSHGLDQDRLDGVRLRAAAFTNLSRDHLDYHPDTESYFAAKARLFADLLPATGVAVLPATDGYGRRLGEICQARGTRVMTYGAGDADIALRDRRPHAGGQVVRIAAAGHEIETDLPLIGAFQTDNVMCALGLVLACGGAVDAALAALAHLTGVPGRLQHVADAPSGGAVYVDYAHKPDALKNALEALRPHARGRLIVLVGCGGDRDRGKRPEMGRIAAMLADDVIITDDNPRSEAPAAIRRAMLEGCPQAREIGDRGEAIRAGVAMLDTGDVLLLAGKGHEQGQEIAGEVYPFDDAEQARAAVAALAGGGHG